MISLRQTDLIIFDCDGVLVDSEPLSNSVMAEHITRARPEGGRCFYMNLAARYGVGASGGDRGGASGGKTLPPCGPAPTFDAWTGARPVDVPARRLHRVGLLSARARHNQRACARRQPWCWLRAAHRRGDMRGMSV